MEIAWTRHFLKDNGAFRKIYYFQVILRFSKLLGNFLPANASYL